MKELLFSVDKTDAVGLQMQLKQQLVDAILSRALQPEERLPSSRKLANYLEISRNTVTLVYQDLVDSGYLQSNSRSGFVVNSEAPVNELDALRATTATRSENGADNPDSTRLDLVPRMKIFLPRAGMHSNPLNWREYEFPFVYGQMDFDLFSHSQWRDCARQALGARDFGFLAGDFANNDDPLLVNYIASHSLARRGVRAGTDDILVTLGAQNALYLIADLLIDETTRVALENPCYPDLKDIISRKTTNVVNLPVDEEGLIPDEAALAECDLVFVTPSHQCPTAVTMSLQRRKKLLDLAREHDFLIVEDDYEFEMNFIKNPSPALKSMDSEGRVLYVGSFSKSLFPGLRLGYLAADGDFIRQARRLRHLMLRHPPGHAQRTAAYFMAMGHYDSQIKRLNRIFAERRDVMQREMDKLGMISGFGASYGGTGFWVKGPDWLNADLLAQNLKEKGVLIETGTPFFQGTERPENYFRAAYSSIKSEKIERGLQLVDQGIRQLKLA